MEIDVNLPVGKRTVLIAVGVVLIILVIVGLSNGHKGVAAIYQKIAEQQREIIQKELQAAMQEKQEAIEKLQKDNARLKNEVSTLKVKYEYLVDRIKAKAQEASSIQPSKDTEEAKAKLKGMGYEVVQPCK